MEDLPSNEREWYSFEKQMSRWLSDNVHLLTPEERRPFNSASLNSLLIGAGFAGVSNLVFNRFGLLKNRFNRVAAASLGGVYVSTRFIARKRRDIYTDLLKSPGPAGHASRKILASTKAASTAYAGYPQEVTAPVDNSNFGASQEPHAFDDNFQKPTDGFFQEESRVEDAPSGFKTWEDIRKESLKKDGYTQ